MIFNALEDAKQSQFQWLSLSLLVVFWQKIGREEEERRDGEQEKREEARNE